MGLAAGQIGYEPESFDDPLPEVAALFEGR